jgi:quinol monooxygenase YgiN
MYGLIAKMIAAPGKRDELISILLEGVATMPGCLSYIVAKDTGDANAIWITEAWDSKASHEASLSLPSVKEAVAKGQAADRRLLAITSSPRQLAARDSRCPIAHDKGPRLRPATVAAERRI